MPIDSLHREYERARSDWRKCRDVIAGQRAVHEAGTLYLPKLRDQTPEEYFDYVRRAGFYNATQRTHDALVGMIFRRDPVIEFPSGMREIMDDVTLQGETIVQFAQVVVGEVLAVGRVGVMVDFPRVDTAAVRSVADAESMQARPFVRMYQAEAIRNWRVDRVGNVMSLTLVVLEESEAIQQDEYHDEQRMLLRALRLVDGVYVQEVFEPVEGNNGLQGPQGQAQAVNPWGGSPRWRLRETITPLMNGRPLSFIPFVIFGADDIAPDVEKPPLLDLVDLNLSHYRTLADYEHGAHFCGLPTVVVSGFRPDHPGQKLYVGSPAAWILPQPDARAYYLEFAGAGLSTLANMLAEKEARMAALGARVLAPEKRAAEAAETAAIHRAGEVSVLAKIANTCARGLERALVWLRDWAGMTGDITVKLNTDYFPVPMDGARLTALIAAWQQGAISKETLFQNLKRGDVIADDRTLEEEEEAIRAAPPMLMQQPGMGQEPVPQGQ